MWSPYVPKSDATRAFCFLCWLVTRSCLDDDYESPCWALPEEKTPYIVLNNIIEAEFWLYLGSHQLSWEKLCGATTWWELPLRLSFKRQQMVFLCHMRVSYTLNQLSERTELLLLLTLLWHQLCGFSWYMQGIYHGNRFLLHISLNSSDPWSFECLLCAL